MASLPLNFFSQQIDPPKYLKCKIMFYCSLSTIKYFFFDIEHQLVIVMKAHVMQMAGRIRDIAKNIQLVWGDMAQVRISYAMISVYFYLVSFEWIAGDSISKENKQFIFGGFRPKEFCKCQITFSGFTPGRLHFFLSILYN